jgi:hypothetical protein
MVLVAEICRWPTLVVLRTKPLRLVATVQELVEVVPTMSTTRNHVQNHICPLLRRSPQKCSSHSFLEVNAVLNSHRGIWKTFCVPSRKMFKEEITKVVAME